MKIGYFYEASIMNYGPKRANGTSKCHSLLTDKSMIEYKDQTPKLNSIKREKVNQKFASHANSTKSK